MCISTLYSVIIFHSSCSLWARNKPGAKPVALYENERRFLCTLRPDKPPAPFATPFLVVRTQIREKTLPDYLNVYRCFAFQDAPQMLSYVELCLNKVLSPIDCMNSTAQCDYNKPVQYPPIVPLDGVIS